MQTRQPMTLVLAGLLALGGCASSRLTCFSFAFG